MPDWRSNISDEDTEFQILERFSFLRFLGLHPLGRLTPPYCLKLIDNHRSVSLFFVVHASLPTPQLATHFAYFPDQEYFSQTLSDDS